MSVVPINKQTKENQEFNAFVSALSFQDWTFKIQSIIQSTSLPLSADFSNKDTLLPNGSMPNRFGHKTLEEYITSSELNMGHNYTWSQWCEEVTSYEFKSKFAIYENDKVEILKQVKDVESSLGRLPNDSSEFHHVKDQILVEQKRDSEIRHQAETRQLNLKIEELSETIELSKQKFANLESELGEAVPPNVIASYIEQIQEKESLIIELKTKISVLESNSNVSVDFEIEKLVENYHTVLDYLNRFKNKNSKLKQEIIGLKSEVKYLKKELSSKNKIIKNLLGKNSKLAEVNLLTTSLFIASMSVMFLYLALLSI